MTKMPYSYGRCRDGSTSRARRSRQTTDMRTWGLTITESRTQTTMEMAAATSPAKNQKSVKPKRCLWSRSPGFMEHQASRKGPSTYSVEITRSIRGIPHTSSASHRVSLPSSRTRKARWHTARASEALSGRTKSLPGWGVTISPILSASSCSVGSCLRNSSSAPPSSTLAFASTSSLSPRCHRNSARSSCAPGDASMTSW
mmetsp:Transcript_96066/g.286716  ORF Transcript_96066/g.286716 Transcript_96066/m.286716 type:complete len:200 (+) Transcript_96066:1090-1689(+)